MCVKGDERSIKALELLHNEALALTQAALRGQENGDAGADEWLKHHHEREALLKNLLDIHRNTDVRAGTPIFLNGNTPNRIEEARARRAITIKPHAAQIKSLDNVTSLLAPPLNPHVEHKNAA